LALDITTILHQNWHATVETTHGIIAASTISYTNSPIIFLSGIVNQVGEFNKQVSPKPEAQNFAAAFNAGIVVAWLLPRLDALEKYS
jgi:hypothetical protein